MKKSLQIFCLSVGLIQATSAWAAENPRVLGINYDPTDHSLAFAKARGLDDRQGMIDSINHDLDQFAAFRKKYPLFSDIDRLKIYNTRLGSSGFLHGQVFVSVPEVVNNWNLHHPEVSVKLTLGVYEFRPSDGCGEEDICKRWTQTEVDEAIRASNTYEGLVDRIVVGNENLGLYDEDNDKLLARMTDDINRIKANLINHAITVGTAQTLGTAESFFRALNQCNDPLATLKADDCVETQNFSKAIDFMGVNIYPFWGNVHYSPETFTPYIPPYADDLSPAKINVTNTWSTLTKLAKEKTLIVTEEGWPSTDHFEAGYPQIGSMGQGLIVGNGNPDFAHDYLFYWHRPMHPGLLAGVSYYFSLFDRYPNAFPGSFEAEISWGLLSPDGNMSLLDGDFNKPLSPDYANVLFRNQLKPEDLVTLDEIHRDPYIKNKVASNIPPSLAVVSCTENNECYPLYGYSGSSMLPHKQEKKWMVDVSGKIYSYLKVTFIDDDHHEVSCRISHDALRRLNNQSELTFTGAVFQTSDGSCGL